MKLSYILIRVLSVLLVSYVLFGIVIFFRQKSMIYFPDKQDFESCSSFRDYEKINFNGTRMYFKRGSSKDALINYHGNAGSVCDRSYLKEMFEENNNSVIFVEYAGFSNDSRKPSRDLILQDVRNVNDFVLEKKFEKILIYGQSIGSGAASYHASLGGVDSLILVTPFSSLEKLAQSMYKIYPMSILLREKYDNMKWLKDFSGELLILHGDSDTVIPDKFSKELFLSADSCNGEYKLILKKGHNDLWSSSNFKEKVEDFLKKSFE